MPRVIGNAVPTRMSFTFTPQNRNDMENAIQNKEFANVAQGINTALRFYFENKGKDAETVVTDLFKKGKFDVVMREAAEGVVIEILEEKKKRTG
jgi:Arc/MetJ-type ribon-helix-helix transcriptional regulator